jgi:medium-chain acyl-[acyl-carrier-protein] hydrolase
MSGPLASESLFVRRAARRGARLRLICLPYGGASASMFGAWPDLLPPDIELMAIQLPGREDRVFEQPFTRLEPLVRTVAQALRPYLVMPCALFGHSSGALIAFELARELECRLAITPLYLIVSGWPAPQARPRSTPIHHLPNHAFVDALREIGGMPRDIQESDDLMQLLLPGLRADFAISERYVYRPGNPLHCPITALGGTRDSRVSPEELAGWIEQTQRHFAVHLFDGGHFFVNEAREEVLDRLSDLLLSTGDAPAREQHPA